MKIMITIFLVVVFSLYSTASGASDLRLVYSLSSTHLNTDLAFNEDNRGFGLEFKLDDKWLGFGNYTDSYYNKQTYLSLSETFNLYDSKHLSLRYGYITGLISHTQTDNKHIPMFLPILEIGSHRVSLSMSYLPKFVALYNVITFQLKIDI